MILQPASRKELKRIAVGSAVCAVLEIALFWLLSVFGIGRFSYRIVTGTVGGTLMGILNFALMCLMIQNATGIADEKLMKAKVRGSYNLRKIIQILWVVAAFLIPGINVLAAAIPLFFPNVVIYYLQFRGKLFPKEDESPKAAPAPAPQEPETEEDVPGPFEV
ncbi:MAG: ATP synthase subunit I [Candidatus Faecousia sp.]|nr:ATP synthase subunit I [Oscillospiraceae bacterium]MDY2557991.1 ATP synthase subunit I [Candidatus Faecousia sp.]